MESQNYMVFFKCNLHSKYDILFNYQNFDQSASPWVFADGTIMPFLTYDKAWKLGNIHDYIDGNINLENIEKKETTIRCSL